MLASPVGRPRPFAWQSPCCHLHPPRRLQLAQAPIPTRSCSSNAGLAGRRRTVAQRTAPGAPQGPQQRQQVPRLRPLRLPVRHLGARPLWSACPLSLAPLPSWTATLPRCSSKAACASASASAVHHLISAHIRNSSSNLSSRTRYQTSSAAGPLAAGPSRAARVLGAPRMPTLTPAAPATAGRCTAVGRTSVCGRLSRSWTSRACTAHHVGYLPLPPTPAPFQRIQVECQTPPLCCVGTTPLPGRAGVAGSCTALPGGSRCCHRQGHRPAAS